MNKSLIKNVFGKKLTSKVTGKFLGLSCSLYIILFCSVRPLLAENFVSSKLKSFAGKSGYITEDLTAENTFLGLLGSIIGVFLGLLGVIFLALTIYSGFTWMTAGGEEAKVTKAKETLKRAIIGLIIVASSYLIWELVALPLIFGV